VVSGGMAWHMMSPVHVEVKKMHDHSDVDLFLIPETAWKVFMLLKENGFRKWWTKYDTKTPNFSRYGTTVQKGKKRVKVILDLFVETVPYRMINGYKIIEVEHLLSLYSSIHSSGRCWAVQQAIRLVANKIDPLGRIELISEFQGEVYGFR